MSKPQGADWKQKAVFSGDKWFHCSVAQGIYGPDGMFYDWFDKPVGRHCDRYFMRDSGVNALLAQLQAGNARQFWAYLDKGYTDNTHVKSAYHGPVPLTAMEIHYNWLMSTVRIGVEWGFGKVKYRNPFILHWRLLKFQMVDVARYIRVAVLLTNAHTCLHQSQTGLYFNCYAPSVEQYFV